MIGAVWTYTFNHTSNLHIHGICVQWLWQQFPSCAQCVKASLAGELLWTSNTVSPVFPRFVDTIPTCSYLSLPKNVYKRKIKDFFEEYRLNTVNTAYLYSFGQPYNTYRYCTDNKTHIVCLSLPAPLYILVRRPLVLCAVILDTIHQKQANLA
jgi:hypothetical protein